jgi:SAM-dependent methyltransferase
LAASPFQLVEAIPYLLEDEISGEAQSGGGRKMANFTEMLARFDEHSYLMHNPDVRDAVDRNQFSSGWHHFVTYGYRENRPGVDGGFLDEFVGKMAALEGASPPAHLRKRVHGIGDLMSFAAVGRTVADDIIRATTSPGGATPRSVLDFGCGCGRILTYLQSSLVQATLVGTDIDAEAIAWCKQNLNDLANFTTNGELPPLPFVDNQFDLVYSVSVFTHLPEGMQFAWLDELKRVTAPGGRLVLTTHGDSVFEGFRLPQQQVDAFNELGFFYLKSGATEGLPDFYQLAFHKHWYIRENWGKTFEILDIISKGINNHQDLVLCRKS